MENNFNRNEILKEIKKKLLDNGFVVSNNRQRDRTFDISKKDRTEIKKDYHVIRQSFLSIIYFLLSPFRLLHHFQKLLE